MTTVEGILQRVKEGLTQDQDRRHDEDKEGASQIDAFVKVLDSYLSLEKTWTLVRLLILYYYFDFRN